MVREIQSILESEMLRSWAKDEVYSIPMRQCFKDKCPSSSIWQKVEKGSNDFSEPELAELEKAIRYCRAPLLDGLLPLGIDWHIGLLPLEELETLKIISFFSFRLGSDRLMDLVRAYQSGRLPANLSGFAESLRDVPNRLRPEEMRGRIIMVGRSENPPYILIEGFKRAISMLLSLQEGGPRTEHIPVILGTCPRLVEWNHCPPGV